MTDKEVKLKVMEALQEEAYKGIVRIDSETMHLLGVHSGDVITINGARETVGIVDRAYPTDVGQNVIRMDGILRRNAKTSIGEFVIVNKAEIKEAKDIVIAPAQKGVMVKADPRIFKRTLLGRAVVKGDIIAPGGTKTRHRATSESPFFEEVFSMFEENFNAGFGMSGLRFIVVNTNPKSAVVITENTEITLNPKSVEITEEKIPEVTYEDIGGLKEETSKIREMVELPLKHPNLFLKLGIDPPKGVLLHGPPGTGKTLLAKAVANECEANFILVNGPEIFNKFYGETEKIIRTTFEDAEKNAPSIIFIDEIDAIAPKREESYGELERRAVSQLLCIDPKTKIYLPEKIIKIKNLYDNLDGELFIDENDVEHKIPKKETRVQALDEDGKIINAKIIALTKTKIPKSYLIKLGNGSEIKTSEITKFLTINNEGIKWINANEVKENQYIIVPRKINFDEKIHKIDISKLSKKDKWIIKLPENGILNKIFDRNYAFLSEIYNLIKNKDIKIRISKKRGDLRDKVLNILLKKEKCSKDEIQNELKISRKSLNNALRIIDKGVIDITENNILCLKVKINDYLLNEIEEFAYKEDSKIYPIQNKYFIKLPKVLDENMAKFLGLLISDGHLYDDGVNVFGETSLIAKDNIEKALSIKTRISKVNDYLRLDIDSKPLAQFFNDYFKVPIGKKSQIVRAPKQIFNSPKSVKAAFIAGLLEGDGGAIDKIYVSSNSKFLIYDIINILLSMGILSAFKKYNSYYAVVYGGHDSYKKFYEILNPHLELKRKKSDLLNLINKQKKISTLIYPVKEKLYEIRKNFEVRLDDEMYRYLSPNISYKINSNILGYMIEKLGNLENEFVSEVRRLYNSDLVPCLVKEVKEIKEEQVMYDLTTTTSNFLAGNIPIVMHNTMMDGLKSRGKVIVIGATNRVNSIDPALRRPGRFDREISIGVPNKEGRLNILKIHTRTMPLAKDVNLNKIAEITHGFVGADINALCKEAAMNVLRRILPELKLENQTDIPNEILEKLMVTEQDFNIALKLVRPSALREVLIEKPNIKWEDVGGLEKIKQELKEAVEWPLKNPEAFKRLGIKAPRGILLYGPPGTGKTLLAKAVATESEANFILVNGPELIDKFVGESSKGIKKIFEKARQSSPAIIFFDEIDSIASKRGTEIGVKVVDQMVNTLLAEIDGLKGLNDILVIGSTNRPDILDTALLRAGRFDRLLLVPPPSKQARLEILKIHTKDMPLSKDVDIDKIAEKTKGYVGADLESICREAGLLALREDMKAKEVNKKHFDEAIVKVKPSVPEELMQRYEELEETYLKQAKAGLIREVPDYFG